MCARVVAVMTSVLLSAGWAAAGTIENVTMGTFYTTIQDAIDAAAPSDTILVGPDASPYVENLSILKPLTLKSSGGPGSTTLSGGSSGTVITIDGVTTGSVFIEGFTISGGDGSMTGVGGGGGVHVQGGSTVTIRDNILKDNFTLFTGAAITVWNSTATITGNLIRDNLGDGGAGLPTGGIWVGKDPMAALPGSTVSILGNNIRANHGSSTGGILVQDDSSVDIISNFIVGNGMGSIGGITYSGSGLVANNVITGNAGGGVGGIDVAALAMIELINNTIAGNFGGSAGGVAVEAAPGLLPTVKLANNIVILNEDSPSSFSPADLLVGEVAMQTPATLSITFNHLGEIPMGLSPLVLDPFSNALGPPVGFLFFSAATAGMPTEMGDYHIIPDPMFPAIDGGSDAEALAAGLMFDLDGSPRIAGAAVDRGAFEFTVVPEPAAAQLLLAAIAMGGLAIVRRSYTRRSKLAA